MHSWKRRPNSKRVLPTWCWRKIFDRLPGALGGRWLPRWLSVRGSTWIILVPRRLCFFLLIFVVIIFLTSSFFSPRANEKLVREPNDAHELLNTSVSPTVVHACRTEWEKWNCSPLLATGSEPDLILYTTGPSCCFVILRRTHKICILKHC